MMIDVEHLLAVSFIILEDAVSDFIARICSPCYLFVNGLLAQPFDLE